MRSRIVRIAGDVWPWLLISALAFIAGAALSTAAGLNALSRTAGAGAWTAALFGAIAGLVSGTGRDE
jgi:hypothetical protein